MAVLQFGYIIQKRREELGLSQEDLADGICSVPTLSRLENGTRMPTQDNFEMLLQRLGLSDIITNNYVDKKTLHLHELKFNIRQAYIDKELEVGKNLLEDFKNSLEKPTAIDKQFILLYDLLLSEEKYSNDETLELLEKAIKYTYPKYNTKKVFYVLSYEEIIILNNIAVCHAIDNKIKKAIDIWYNIKEYYDEHIINTEEALRTQLMVLVNLSEALQIAGRYDECIEICDIAINITKSTARCRWLSRTLRMKAISFLKKDKDKYYDEILQLIKKSYYMAYVLEDEEELQETKEFIQDNAINFDIYQ
ncbi:MAG: helix-turn-helix domain-containing protein [Acutalibacteraceae bacterium]